MNDSDAMEQTLWKDAVNTLQKSGLKVALTKLLNASCSATSVRQRNRYRLLIARLCLKAERPDLARPIVEELHQLVETLNLEQWESPLWIAELLDAFYLCLKDSIAIRPALPKNHYSGILPASSGGR